MRRFVRVGSTLVLALLAAACSADGTSNPVAVDAPAARADVPQADTVCDVLAFDGLAHGDTIRTVTALGLTLPLFVVPGGRESSPVAIAYDTNTLGGPDDDLEWNGPGAKCRGCEGLGRIMVFGNPYGFERDGDGEHGGVILISGFHGADFWVDSWTVIENDSYEPPVLLVADQSLVSFSHRLGNGSVERPQIFKHTFKSHIMIAAGTFTDPNDWVNGSGGYDNIRICKTVPASA